MSKCYINLAGGIGNQLFQIAAAYAYSKKYDKELVVCDAEWTAMQGRSPSIYKETLYRNFKFGEVIGDVTEIQEQEFNYNELPFHEGDVRLSGYFQSLLYFEDCKDEFISKLTFPEITISSADKSVAFHIRRGDYLSLRHIFLVCENEYFNDMFKKFEGYEIHVFTDQPDLIEEDFYDYDFRVLKSSSELNEMVAISQHTNIVCSNSSFSWWASLIGGPKENVYVPDKWFADGREHSSIYSNRNDFTKIKV